MKTKLQIDASQLTSEVTQEVLRVIKPLLPDKEKYTQRASISESVQQTAINALPQFGLLRLWQILGNRRKGIPPIIPVSKSSWWAGVKSGKYPKPVKLSARCTCWRTEDIRELLERMGRP
ncbi:MAG TPA: AlpA family phage regulatory protein [Nitrospirota bacterium]|nr:AlpA family phage regulatory protein [Nitrospirota bacterium]